jgi:hypothetical protein
VRTEADADRIRAFLRELARAARTPATVYLIGGATAVIAGWRAATISVDIRIEPESDEILRAIPALKNALDINVELASPPDFIPELPGWRDRSAFVVREGQLDIRHFDFYSQAVAKIERGFVQDLEDVGAMLDHGLIDPANARDLFARIEPELYRYPAIDPGAFRERIDAALC